MHALAKIHCKTCSKIFPPVSEKNKFCCRKCFKKDFYHRTKALELSRKRFPDFICPECDIHITLDFDPYKESEKWLEFKCPGCNTLMICVSEKIVVNEVQLDNYF